MAVNLNIGVLGHVDAGKTSIAKALSEIASTACFDKNPQSQSRGITLDLGFSSFSVSTPEHLKNLVDEERIQYTLVDCPGHASLIKTIIGGAQIIDMMLLVVDVSKGIQTQTAECIVIGEITCHKMVVALNKIDLLEDHNRKPATERMIKKLKSTFANTVFKDVSIVLVSACPNKMGIEDLINEISNVSFIPKRSGNDPFLLAVDHCFGIKGQGTVLTGTVLQGCINVNDAISIPSLNVTKKIKSMQMFKKPVNSASQGDRIGICVTQMDATTLERGIVCAPGLANFIHCAVIPITKIKYFKNSIKSRSKFHITIGHETALAAITCFSGPIKNFQFEREYEYCEDLDEDNVNYFLILEFEKPILAVPNSLIIGSKLDMDVHTSSCRIAFWGRLAESSKDKDYKATFLPKIKIFKKKTKTGWVERRANDETVIVKNIFKKETNVQVFIGLRVNFSNGDTGIIESTFGHSGKIKVRVQKNATAESSSTENNKTAAVLNFKRYIYDTDKKVVQ